MEKKIPSAKKPSSSRSRPLSKGRGKSAGKKPKKVAEPFVSKYNLIDFEKAKEVPEITLTVKFDQVRTEGFFYDMKLPINMTLRKAMEKINEKHMNSCHNIRIFILENSAKKYMDNLTYKTFKDLGIKPGDNLNLYYEYEPAIHPLLEAGLV